MLRERMLRGAVVLASTAIHPRARREESWRLINHSAPGALRNVNGGAGSWTRCKFVMPHMEIALNRAFRLMSPHTSRMWNLGMGNLRCQPGGSL